MVLACGIFSLVVCANIVHFELESSLVLLFSIVFSVRAFGSFVAFRLVGILFQKEPGDRQPKQNEKVNGDAGKHDDRCSKEVSHGAPFETRRSVGEQQFRYDA